MDTKEINLISLFFDVLLHWRSILIMGIICALLGGGYGTAKNASDTVMNKNGQVIISESDKDAVFIYSNSVRDYENMRDALSESAYMSLDGRNVAKTEVMLVVKGKRIERISNIADQYRKLLVSQAAVDYIRENAELEDAGIADLIITDITANVNENAYAYLNSNMGTSVTASATTNVDSRMITDSDIEWAEPVSYIILGEEAASSEKMAGLMIDFLNLTKDDIVNEWGEHTLTVMSSKTTVDMDLDVISRQSANDLALVTLYDSVCTQKKLLSKEQLAFYDYMISENDDSVISTSGDNEQHVADKALAVLFSVNNVKYIMVGLFFGVLCMAGFWSAIFCLSNRIKADDPIEKLLGVCVVGVIPFEHEEKKMFGFVDKWIISIRDRNKHIFSVDTAVSLVTSQIKVQGSKDKISKLVFIGCDLKNNMSGIPELMAEKFKDGSMTVTILDNVLYDPESAEHLAEMDGAVILEKAGKSLYSELADEIDLLKRQQINLLGCVIVE